jgi:Uma2 family endonuclease
MAMPDLVPELFKGPFTVADYHRMAESGLLHEDSRVELLDGMVVEMSPIGSRHADCVNRLTERLVLALAGRAIVSVQNPVILDERSEPQPDVAVWKRRPEGYAAGLPRPKDVLLVIEVVDTTAYRDKVVKIPLYARARTAEVWLVRLDEDVVEIHREPGADGYGVVRSVGRGETLTPSLLPSVTLSVADILG